MSLVKILVADDLKENLLVMEAIFADSGYQVFQAKSGKEALELAKLHKFACILLDVQMPVLNGFETARALRQIPSSQHTPIIFITALIHSWEYEEEGYSAGAVDYIFKPFNPKNLLAKVAIFVELYLQAEEIKRKNVLLEEAIEKAKENEQLKVALKTRDEFLMMASHELKTPITPLTLQMQTFIDLFENGTAANVEPEKLLRMLHTSQGQVERLARLIHDLVDVTKVSANKMEINCRKMNLCRLVEKVLIDFDSEIKKSGSDVECNIPSDIDGQWDVFRLEQVVVNLLSNALKYGNGKPILIEASQKNGKVHLFIQDNGIGIRPEDHYRVFRRFERAVSGNSFSGLGLGLYISKQIIALHQGRIWVDSEEGKGSTFQIELPLESQLCT